jgi:hypothetical protein
MCIGSYFKYSQSKMWVWINKNDLISQGKRSEATIFTVIISLMMNSNFWFLIYNYNNCNLNAETQSSQRNRRVSLFASSLNLCVLWVLKLTVYDFNVGKINNGFLDTNFRFAQVLLENRINHTSIIYDALFVQHCRLRQCVSRIQN